MTRSLWFLESFTDKEPICDGKLAGLVSLFLLIGATFNLDRNEGQKVVFLHFGAWNVLMDKEKL